jgi:hypothetical protein
MPEFLEGKYMKYVGMLKQEVVAKVIQKGWQMI